MTEDASASPDGPRDLAKAAWAAKVDLCRLAPTWFGSGRGHLLAIAERLRVAVVEDERRPASPDGYVSVGELEELREELLVESGYETDDLTPSPRDIAERIHSLIAKAGNTPYLDTYNQGYASGYAAALGRNTPGSEASLLEALNMASTVLHGLTLEYDKEHIVRVRNEIDELLARRAITQSREKELSHVHPTLERGEDGMLHPGQCAPCLAREKAQEELVAEFVRQEERIEKCRATLADAEITITAREEEVKRLREALVKIVRGEEEAPVGMSNPTAVAREALSSLDAHATKD